jgi:hypothetical protein
MFLIARTDSVAHLNSMVPTAAEAKKGVKEKYEFGDMIVTVIHSLAPCIMITLQHTIVEGFIYLPESISQRACISDDLPSDVVACPSTA